MCESFGPFSQSESMDDPFWYSYVLLGVFGAVLWLFVIVCCCLEKYCCIVAAVQEQGPAGAAAAGHAQPHARAAAAAGHAQAPAGAAAGAAGAAQAQPPARWSCRGGSGARAGAGPRWSCSLRGAAGRRHKNHDVSYLRPPNLGLVGVVWHRCML